MTVTQSVIMIPDFLWLVLHISESCSLITFLNLVLVTLWISFLSSSSSDKNSFYPVPKLYFRWVATINWSVVLPPDMGEKEKKNKTRRKEKRSHSMHLQNRNLINMLQCSSCLFLHIAEPSSLRHHILIHISVILSRKFLRLFLHILNLVFFIIRY